jgi:hypothetical protein
MKRGDTFTWTAPGTDLYLGDVRPVRIEVVRSARDETWADVRCTDAGGAQWVKRHPTAPGCVPVGWQPTSPDHNPEEG